MIGYYQRAARVDRDPDRPAARLPVLADETGDEIHRRAGRTAITERHENHLVAGGFAAVPAAVLADEYTLDEACAHRWRRKRKAECGDMRAKRIIGRYRGGNLRREIGRENIRTPVTNSHPEC